MPTVTVPNLSGLSIYTSEAKEAVLGASLTMGTAQAGPLGGGDVYAQNPTAGSSVASGTAVNVQYHRSSEGGVILWGN